MAVVNDVRSVLFYSNAMVNHGLFYCVFNHAIYNASGGGLKVVNPTILSNIRLHLLLSLLPVELARAEQSCKKKVPFG